MNKQIWHDATKERPDHDAEVLILTKCMFGDTYYLKVVDKFNCHDPNDTTSAIEPWFWAYRDDIINQIYLELGVDYKQMQKEYYEKLLN